MLDGFRTWYVDRMAELAPASARAAFDRPADATLVVAGTLDDRGRVMVIARRRGREEDGVILDLGQDVDPNVGPNVGLAFGQEPGRNQGRNQGRKSQGRKSQGRNLGRSGAMFPAAVPVLLRLPPGFVLERAITLPLVAEQGLRTVLAAEMGRYTPFEAEQVVWTAQIVARDRAAEKLRCVLAVVPRAPLQPLLDALARRTLNVSAIEAPARPQGPRHHLPLSGAAPGRRSRIGLLAGAAIAALLVAIVAEPFLRLQAQSDTIERRIADLQPRYDLAQALRRRIAAQANGTTAMAAEQARLGSTLATMAALTRVLPDDTYLTSLTVHARQLTIEGQSAAASKLIGALSSDPVIQNAAFAAPVTRNDAGLDLFSLRAEVRP